MPYLDYYIDFGYNISDFIMFTGVVLETIHTYLRAIAKNIKNAQRNKISFVVLRNASKNTQQISFTSWKFFGTAILTLAIIFTVSLMTVYYFFDHDKLLSRNIALSKELLQQEDEIDSLHSINTQQSEEILDLKDKLVYSAEYFNEKLDEVNELQGQVTTLVATLNKSTNSDINIPVSRSFDRNNQVFNPLEVGEDGNIYKELIADDDEDALSIYMEEQIAEFSKLVTDVESQLSYLECRPDFTPTTGQITSYFGYRIHPITKRRSMHDGLDFGADRGTAIKSAGSGIVTFSGTNGGYGKTIVISHGYGYKTVYAHNKFNLVAVGDKIEKGQKIGEVGNTGRSTGPHLHFEVHYNGVQINPMNILDL